MLLFILWWPLLVELFISLDSRSLSVLIPPFQNNAGIWRIYCQGIKNVTGNDFYSKNSISVYDPGPPCMLIVLQRSFSTPTWKSNWMRCKAFSMITSESVLLRHHFNNRERFTDFCKVNKHLRCNIFTEAMSSSILSKNSYLFLHQHKQTLRKYWIESLYIGVHNSLYPMNLADFQKILHRISLLLNTSKSKQSSNGKENKNVSENQFCISHKFSFFQKYFH